MKFDAAVFRLRFWLFLAIYTIGFTTPWNLLGRPSGGPPSTLWLASSTLFARTGWGGVAMATVTVTCFALACMVLGAVLRVWGTAYLGAGIMSSGAMHGDRVLAAGPFRFVRNPLYLGTWLFGAGVSFLMPPSGALFFILATGVVIFLLVRGEEHFLSSSLGEPYAEYRRRVPRFLPLPVPRQDGRIPSSALQPHWLQSLTGEVLVVGYTACFAVLAWRYDVRLLLRCLLICLGASLVLRGVASGTRKPGRPVPPTRAAD